MGYTINKDTKITVALLPKHPTRKATDKILKKNDKFMDIVTIKDYQQLVALTGTCHVAIVGSDGKYYKITPTNAEKQFELAVTGQALTADKVDTFGIVKLDNFITDPITNGSTDATKVKEREIGSIQKYVKVYNGVVTGTLNYVTGYTKFDEHNTARQSGYYVVISYKKTDAEASATGKFKDVKYTVIGDSFGQNKEDLADGDNVIYLGPTKEDALSRKLFVEGTITIGAKVYPVELYLKLKLEYMSNTPTIQSNLPKKKAVRRAAAPTPPPAQHTPIPPRSVAQPPQSTPRQPRRGGSESGGGTESSQEGHS